MRETVLQYIRKNRMFHAGEKVTIAVSGGADSVCLLLLLCELQEDLQICPDVLHVHHGLRGEAADSDEAFVRSLCREKGLPLDVRHVDVGALAAERGIGTEEAGRLARRGIYAEKKTVALAHHLGDQAETFLFRVARGTSIAGLVSMRPAETLFTGQAGGTRLVRPLLGVTRQEIENYLTARAQSWCEDATNADEIYTRNGIRHSVIPALEEKVNREAVRHIAAAAEDLRAADAFLREEAARRGEGVVRVAPSIDGEEPCEEILLYDELLALPEVLQGYLILDAMHRAAGTRRDIGRLHVEQLRELFALPAGKKAELPHGIRAVRTKDAVRLSGGKGGSLVIE